MLGAHFLPSRLRGYDSTPATGRPGWYNRHVTPFLQSVSRRACTHPIHTIVFIALLASTSYLGLLDASLFESTSVRDGALGNADFNTLLAGSKRLRVGAETGWKWQSEDGNGSTGVNSQNLALVTFVFPDSTTNSMRTAPAPHHIEIPQNCSAKLLPSSTNPLSTISHDTTLAFSLPYDEASDFLISVQEIRATGAETRSEVGKVQESKMWIMKAARTNLGGSAGVRAWASDSWNSFLDLIKHAESLDVIIMVIGYLSMHLTFVSLFLSMRRLGSNFWLAATVLLQSVFSFLFGLIVTTKLGVPINVVLLSEGLPFLVVTIGFEKPIILTKAVLSASLDSRRLSKKDGEPEKESAPSIIQNAVQSAVKERGFDIIKDYCIEILILVIGAASGVQGGLRQFCFLAAWILFFDCILLFTFYTSILTIKLEINRIKRHVALRRALEDDGISRSVAENVAKNNDFPTSGQVAEKDESSKQENTVFGRQVKDINLPRFKGLMVAAFILINLINICTIPFRGGHRNNTASTVSSLSSVVTQPPMDPFKVAGSGLDTIFASAVENKIPTVVTVLAPIKYELEYPSVHYAVPHTAGDLFEDEYNEQYNNSMGGRVVGSILKSLEDPVLSKWIIAALALSLVLNGYLFNAARWSIKDPAQPSKPPKDSEIMDGVPGGRVPSLVDRPTGPDGVPPPPNTIEPTEKDDFVPAPVDDGSKRSMEECERLLREKKAPFLNDEELIELSLKGKIPGYALEKTLENKTRAVKIRRAVVSRTHATRQTSTLLEKSKLPYENYNYDLVHGACCENVIGYLPLPLGVAGPLRIDGQNYFLPMATTEGVLVASVSRGCKAINAAGGAVTVLTGDGMTRGPCVQFETLARAGAAKIWLDSDEGQRTMKDAFNSTSRFARLQTMKTAIAGSTLFIRFKTTTGDAMGMNMISKGVEHALQVMATESGFDDMQIISVSGNYCTDKKAAAINWIDGRGKSVVAEAIVPADVVKSVLKSDVDALVELNTNKNLIGSAMAGALGGFNAHAANMVAAVFLATGQDPAQVVESGSCITTMRKTIDGALQIAVSMPCIEVGTIGGGTILEAQSAMLDLLGVKGAHPTNPGDNARQLARIVCAAVLAGELSLCSALRAGHLVKAHMAHNRSVAPSRATTPAPSGVQTPTTMAMTSIKEAAGVRSAR